MTLTEFIEARISEDEAAAQDREQWSYEVGDTWWLEGVEHDVVRGPGHSEVAFTFEDAAVHIARFDPARILAECASKREVLCWYTSLMEHGCVEDWDVGFADSLEAVLRSMARVHADHPDFLAEWSQV